MLKREPLAECETTPHGVQRQDLLEAVVPGAFLDKRPTWRGSLAASGHESINT